MSFETEPNDQFVNVDEKPVSASFVRPESLTKIPLSNTDQPILLQQTPCADSGVALFLLSGPKTLARD
ncbi:MAG: hypothetical protein DWI00_14565 [Planctomycetota bacterium]|nr:MAG: hypothetical protein DWI00_14565 [Planctomycetota bacterium]